MATQPKRSNGRPAKRPRRQTETETAAGAQAAGENIPEGSPAAQVGCDIDHFQDIRDSARAIRACHSEGGGYDGRLTAAMMVELEALLEQPTPGQYVKHIGPTEGKPYPSTGLASTQYQLSMMNAVFGGPHWRALTHYENDGRLCKVVVIVGNDLTKASLTADGDLDPAGAELLAVRDGWGAVKRGNTDGDLLKGSYTNAIKRVLAEYGAGADVYRFEFDDESLGGVENPAPSRTARERHGRRAGQGGVGSERRRDQRKVGELIALARSQGLDQHTVVNIAYALAGKEAVPVEQTEAVFKGLLAHAREHPAYAERLMKAIRQTPPRKTNGDGPTAADGQHPSPPDQDDPGTTDPAAAGAEPPPSAPDLGQL